MNEGHRVKPVRVTIIVDVDLDSSANGIAAYLRTFLNYAKGVTCSVWSPLAETQPKPQAPASNCREIARENWVARRLPARIKDLVTLWGKRRNVTRDADVLFIQQSDYVLPFLLGGKWPPIVLVMHGWNPREIAELRGWKRYIWLRIVDSIAVRKAASVIMVSREGLRGFQRRYPTHIHKIVHIPTFLDDEFMRHIPARSTPRRGESANGPILLCVTRLVPEKQVDKIIEVYALVRREYPKAMLTVLGDGPERQRLECMTRQLGVELGVRFQGSITHEDIGCHLGRADYFLLLSKWEGTSIALLEALAYGLSVVVTDIADHSLLVDPSTPGLVIESATETKRAASWIINTYRARDWGTPHRRGLDIKYLASTQVPEICRILCTAR